MVWRKSESTVIPDMIDMELSKNMVYLRRNIRETRRLDEISGEFTTFYEYEETVLTKNEYIEYLKISEIVNLQQLRADIDYISLYLDIPQ